MESGIFSETYRLHSRIGTRMLALCIAALLVSALCFLGARIAKAETEQPETEFEFYSNEEYEYGSDGKSIVLYNYTGSDKDVTIPSTIDGLPVTVLGGYMFYGDTEARTVRIPEGVTAIEGESFVMITKPLTVYIPASLTDVTPYVFSFCTKLKLVIDEDNRAFKVENNALLSYDGKVLYDHLNCNAKSYVIPDGVERIEPEALKDHKKLISITIPDSVTSIGYEAFYGCESLRAITLPDSLTEIEESAFAYCKSIKSIEVPKGVKTIAPHAFEGCEKLSKLVLQDDVTTIGEQAFSWCSKLADFELPQSVTGIGAEAFSECCALSDLAIPAGTKEIGTRAFQGCDKLVLSLAADNRSYTLRDGVLYRYGTVEITGAVPGMVQGDIILPDGVTEIPNAAFKKCRLLHSIVLPKSVKIVDYNAFAECSNLTGIVLPEGLTEIESSAFSGCSALTAVQLPTSLTGIGTSAFLGCTSLAYIDIPRTVTDLLDSTFKGCTALKHVGLKNGLKFIGVGVFTNCPALETVIIPGTVANIGNYNFSGCDKVTVYTSSIIYRDAFSSRGVNIRDIEDSIETAVFTIDGKAVPVYGVNTALTRGFRWETFREAGSPIQFQYLTVDPDLFRVPVQNCIGMEISIKCGKIHFNTPSDVPFQLGVRTGEDIWENGDMQTPMVLREGKTVTLSLAFNEVRTLSGWVYLPAEDPGTGFEIRDNELLAPVFYFLTPADAEAYLAAL